MKFAKFTAAFTAAVLAGVSLCACEGSGSAEGSKQLMLDALSTVSSYTQKDLDSGIGQKTEMSISFSDYLKELAGVSDLEDISLSVDSKAKGDLSGGSVDVTYGGESIFSGEVLTSSDDGSVYIKSDVLGSKYIKTDEQELASLASGVASSDYDTDSDSDTATGSSESDAIDDYLSDYYSGSSTNELYDALDSDALDEIYEAIEALVDIDSEQITSDLKASLEAGAGSIDDAREAGEKSFCENGVTVTLQKRAAELDSEDMAAFVTAMLESLKNSATAQAISDALGEDISDDMDSLIEELESDISSNDDKQSVDLYYYDGEFAGIGSGKDDYYIFADSSNGYLMSMKSSDLETSAYVTAVKDEDDKLDVTYVFETADTDYSDFPRIGDLYPKSRVSVSLEDFEFVNDDELTFNGKLASQMPFTLEDEDMGDIKLYSQFTGEDRSETEAGTVLLINNGEENELINYSVTSERTGASDIALPDDDDCTTLADAFSSLSDEDYKALQSVLNGLGDTDTDDDSDDDSYDDLYDYDDSAIYDCADNYGVDFTDYYNDSYTEFDMDGYLEDAEAAGYPDMDSLKEEIENSYEYYLTTTPNLSVLETDYDVYYYDYYNDYYTEFDMDGFLADAEKASYPDMDALKEEIESCYTDYITSTPYIDILYYDYDISLYDYYDEDTWEFDSSAYLEAAEKAGYPDIDGLKSELEDYYGYDVD